VGKYGTLGSAFDRIFRNTLNKALDDVDTDINAQKKRVDDLIKGTPQPSEVVDARGGKPVLKDRLDDLSSSLAQNAKKIGKKGNLTEYEHLKVGTDWGNALNTALAENDIVEVNAGSYNSSVKINVGTKKIVGIGGLVEIKLTANVDGVEWEGDGFIENIRVNAFSVPNYSKRCFVFRAKGVVQHKTLARNIKSYMNYVDTESGGNIGKGLFITNRTLDTDSSSTTYISYCIVDGYMAHKGYVGFEIDVAPSGGGFIQGNTFGNFVISSSIQIIEPTMAKGNVYPGYMAQLAKNASGSATSSDIRGTFNMYVWDPVGTAFNLKDRASLTGYIDPIALNVSPDDRLVNVNSPLIRIEDGLAIRSFGWPLDIYHERTGAESRGYYEFVDYCEGQVLNPKWKLTNLTQSPLGVQDTRQNHGITLAQTDFTQVSKASISNLFMTRSRFPRLLATIRNKQGGAASGIVNSHCQIGFMGADEQNGFWIELNHDSNNGYSGQQALVYAITRNGGVETKQQIMRADNAANPLVVGYGAKATVEITVLSNKIRFFVSVENYNATMSYGQQNYYNRYLSSGGVVEITTNLPIESTVLEPAMRYSSVPSSATIGGRALTFFNVKSRYL
jgi:hypothetical protein